MDKGRQLVRLVLTTIFLLIPPILLIVYGKEYASLKWDSSITHGIFMLFGFVLFMGTAVTSFRNMPFKSRDTRKLIHALLHTACLLFMIIGWAQIYKITHDNHSHSHESGDSHSHGNAHYLSVHSWLGVLTMIIFAVTYVFGAVVFNPYLKFIKPSIRMAAKPYHISAGIGVTLLAAAATTTGVYNYVDKYVPEIFKKTQTDALRLILSTALFIAIAFFVLMFSLGTFQPNVKRKEVQVKEMMVKENVNVNGTSS